MRVLIVGGTRFVGYQLAWRLIAGGHAVTLVNRGTTPDPFGDRVRRVVADRTTPAFASALTGQTFDAAVDFAAYTGDDARGAVDALRGRVGHYLFIGTGQVYLVREGCPKPARESDYDGPVMTEPTDPADHRDWLYGVGKRDAEDLLARAWDVERFPATRFRLPMINGERDHYRRVENYLWRLLDGGPVILPDGGTTPTRHVYSGAVVRALADAIGDPATFGRAYNLAQDETPTLAEIVAELARLIGAPGRTRAMPADAIRAAGLDPAVISPFSGRWMSFLDPALAKAELGFQHEPLADYLARVVAVFLNAPPASPPPGYQAHRRAERGLWGQS